MKTGMVYLIPTVIAQDTAHQVISCRVSEVVKKIDYFLVENERTARRYIGSLNLDIKIDRLTFEILDKNSDKEEVKIWLAKAEEGKDIGILSESGCPGIADPGALAVEIAHQKGIRVVPLSGPSSILMALMGSGFNGQSFAFHGYLPIEKHDREKKIKMMEKSATEHGQTQLFMDTPYRNLSLFEDLLKHCHPQTWLSIARDITGKREWIKTMRISDWKSVKVDLHKIPVIFSINVEGVG